MTFDYSTITEQWDQLSSREQAEMARVRYRFAAANPADVCVEVACGTGMGLGLLATTAAVVVGCDIEMRNLTRGRAVLPGGAFVANAADALPFANGSVDKVVCLEALYYFADADAFVREARRVLRPGGELVISVVNPRRPGFISSPGARRYWFPTELRALVASGGFDVDVFGAFAWSEQSGALTALRTLAHRFHLIPRSLKARALLKRILGTPMKPLAEALQDEPTEQLVPLRPDDDATPSIVLLLRAHAS